MSMEFKSGDLGFFLVGLLRAFAVLRWALHASTRHFRNLSEHEPCLRRADGRPGALEPSRGRLLCSPLSQAFCHPERQPGTGQLVEKGWERGKEPA